MQDHSRLWTEAEQQQILGWLKHVLAHALFAQSARQQALLQFVVDESLAGRAHLLKGYTLGVEVFERGADFDPITDSIVRVEVARLRSKLIEYYAGEGGRDEVVFDLPKGSYAPVIRFERKSVLIADDKPSLAVLPFVDVGGDPGQGYFADGLTDDLITDLSKLSGMFVISRQSAFVYKNSAKRARDIAAELGVHHLLVGSVRRAGDRVRITAQLVDALSGLDLWAERYDRDIADLFAVQDDVARCIVSALQVRLSGFESERLGHGGTENVEAHDVLLRGLSEYWHFSREKCEAAQAYFRQALLLDPDYAVAHAWMARSYVMQFSLGWRTQKSETLELALAHARRAVEIDDLLPLAHAMMCWVHIWLRHAEIAIMEGQRACALNPNDADAHLFFSFSLSADGRGEEALRQIEQGMRLNPHPSSAYLLALGQAYAALGDYDATIAAARRGIEINPDFVANHVYLAVYSALLGREQEAAAAAAETRRIYTGALPSPMFTDPKLFDAYVKGYHLVGFDQDVRIC